LKRAAYTARTGRIIASQSWTGLCFCEGRLPITMDENEEVQMPVAAEPAMEEGAEGAAEPAMEAVEAAAPAADEMANDGAVA
jgi:hypothetical protein